MEQSTSRQPMTFPAHAARIIGFLAYLMKPSMGMEDKARPSARFKVDGGMP